MNFIVKEDVMLLEFLIQNIKNKSKNNIKNLLTNKMIKVNNKVITKYNYILKINDKVEIIKKVLEDIDIIYEDNDLIVVNKPSGLLTVSTEKETEKTLYKYVSSYIKKINKKMKIFIVHRLDKDTSGIVVFAKNEKIKKILQDNWNEMVTRKYYAVVDGILKEKQGVIKSYLKEGKNYKTYSSKSGELAITEYKVIEEKNNTLLEINIKTGKKNQIRVHLNDINHPIIGDKKYNSKIEASRLMLHAYKLYFTNPINNKKYCFEIEKPLIFDTYLKR